MLIGIVATIVMMTIGILAAWSTHLRSERLRALPIVARTAGLEFSESDRFNCTAVAFPLFRAGDGRKVENVMWRDGGNSHPVRVFDYSWYSEHRDNSGRVRRRWQHVTCSLAQHNGKWPELRVARQGLVDSLGERLGLRSIDLESEEFNRLFFVRCSDARFATDLLDPQMMQFLLTTEGKITFETKGRFVLLSTSRLDAKLMPGLLAVADEFVARVPPVVYDVYGRFPDVDDSDTVVVGEEGLSMGDVWRPSVVAPMDWRPQRHEFAPQPDLRRENDPWDPTPGLEHDLEGNVVDTTREDPWGPGRPPPVDP
jgi:hypothetical protein